MNAGFNVSMPLLDASPYDCILEKDGVLWKVQVKSIGLDRYNSSKGTHIVLRRTSDAYTLKEVDYFAIWYEEHQGFFIIKNELQKAFRLNLTGKYKDNFSNFAQIS